MFRRIPWHLVAITGFLLGGLASPSLAETLKKGDRVVFLGDSITQQGAGNDGYVTLVRATLNAHFPDLQAVVIGAGISGNKVPNLEQRLDGVLTSNKPTLVVIYIGINDVWHSQSGKGTKPEDYEKGLKSLIERITAAKSGVVLCTPTVIGEKQQGENQLDKMLDEYSDISRKVAKETKTPLIDLRKACVEYIKANNKDNAEKGLLTTDRVHLNKAGNVFVAKQMLAGLLNESAGEKVNMVVAQKAENPMSKATTPEKQQGATSEKVLRHVVLFKFKKEITPEQIKEVEVAFAALPKKIPEIQSFEWGTNNSPEGLSKDFTHCFLVTFRDEKGRAVYLPHPEHLKFVDLVKPRLEEAFVVDYWTP
jgi:lysophospholipase L1-like esterase